MKTVKQLAATVALTLVLGVSAFAGDPCAPPEPGQTSTPPCAMNQPSNPGETQTPPAAAPGQIETPPAAVDEAYLTEIAASVMFGIMSLF